MPVVNIEGVDINYLDEGKGHPIMLIHGFSSNLYSWDEQMPALLGKYRVVRYDCRAHGKSESPADPAAYSQEILVREALGLLDVLRIERAFVCGHSMGGNVALHMAINHPDRVDASIVACTGSGSSEDDGFKKRFKAIAEMLDRGELERFTETLLNAPSFSVFGRLRPDILEKQKGWLLGNDAEGLAKTIRGVQMKRPSIMSLEEELKNMNVPSLILVGEEDMPCTEPAYFMRKHIPRSKLVVFPKTGHILNLERPADFNREVMAFLSAVESGDI
jgi:pimeloyl-ACP methyl ester carboxylesterase